MPRPDQAPPAQFERGPADISAGPQLEQGEAQALNEGLAAVPEAEGVAVPEQVGPAVEEEPPTDDVAPAAPADYEPIFNPETEDEEFLTGPTLRPDEAQSVGATPRAPITPAVRRALPTLQRAASEPGASEQLQRLVEYLLREA